jgi:hypothetical protein
MFFFQKHYRKVKERTERYNSNINNNHNNSNNKTPAANQQNDEHKAKYELKDVSKCHHY